MAQISNMNLVDELVQTGVDFYVSFSTTQGTQQNVIKGCVVRLPLDYDFRRDGNSFQRLRELVAEAYKPHYVFVSDEWDYHATHIRIVAWSRMDAMCSPD